MGDREGHVEQCWNGASTRRRSPSNTADQRIANIYRTVHSRFYRPRQITRRRCGGSGSSTCASATCRRGVRGEGLPSGGQPQPRQLRRRQTENRRLQVERYRCGTLRKAGSLRVTPDAALPDLKTPRSRVGHRHVCAQRRSAARRCQVRDSRRSRRLRLHSAPRRTCTRSTRPS